MKHKIFLIAALAALPLAIPANAEAGERCKTYTKHVRIDGRLEVGYGKACLSDGVWRIVKLSGHNKARERIVERIYDDLYDDDVRVVIVDRDYHGPRPYYSTHVSYSKPYYYRHAYDYGRYKHAKKHYKKAKKHYRKHHQCHDHY